MNLRITHCDLHLEHAASTGTVSLTADWPLREDDTPPIRITVTLPLSQKVLAQPSVKGTRQLLEETARNSVNTVALQQWIAKST